MENELRIEIASPPDRNKLVANVMIGSNQFAELNQELDALRLEVYPNPDGGPWLLQFKELLAALHAAKEKLVT